MLATYKASGKFSPIIFTFLPAAVAAAAALAWVYSLLLEWIPFIFLNFVITGAFALTMGFLTHSAVRIGKCRNVAVAALVGSVIGLAGLAASHYWTFSSMVRTSPTPVPFLEYVAWRADTGWSIGGRSGSSSGLPITGIFVYVVWLAEAAAIILGGALGGVGAATTPFCEDCGVWADNKLIEFSIPGLSDDSVQRLAKAAEIDGILLPPLGEVKPALSEVVYAVQSCPGCKTRAHVSLTHKVTVQKPKGKPEIKSAELLKDVCLDQSQTEALVALKSDIERALSITAVPSVTPPIP